MGPTPAMTKWRVRGPLEGVALLIYVGLVPYVVATRWGTAASRPHEAVVRALLVALCVFWLGFLASTIRNIVRLRRGERLGPNGSVWVATLVLSLLPFLGAHPAGAQPVATHHSAPAPAHLRDGRALYQPGASLVPLALAAKRRADQLRRSDETSDAEDVDDAVTLLRGHDPALLSALRASLGDAFDAVVDVVPPLTRTTSRSDEPVVACALGPGEVGTLVSLARAGGWLTVLPTWRSDDFSTVLTALHDGTLTLAATYDQLLRALATRSLHHGLVVFTGDDRELDDELRALCVRIRPTTTHSPALDDAAPGVVVELLRAEPTVRGLSEPFLATLRRRCVEMTAYLALHHDEPITGDRLRSRVLGGDETDASIRTLANTASAVRRSLGRDEAGPRLHPVTSAGLYTTHGVTCDVTLFHSYVARARDAGPAGAAHAERALGLIRGEPLATALRGFEWFLAEGHAATLARDAAWAATAVCDDALARGNVDLAQWALHQGLLVDPFNDELRQRRIRTARSGELGRD